MNLTELLSQAGGGQGFDALARRFGVTPEQARGVAGAALPALSSGMKRMAASPSGVVSLAGALRATDAEQAFDAPDAADAKAEATGAALLDQIFGGARGDIEQAVSDEASGRSGLDTGLIMKMLPAIAAMALGGLQKRESADEGGLGALVGGLLGGGGATEQSAGGMGGLGSGGLGSSGLGSSGLGGLIGGLLGGAGAASNAVPGQSGSASDGLGALMQMLDADQDGSIADDLLDRFMK